MQTLREAARQSQRAQSALILNSARALMEWKTAAGLTALGVLWLGCLGVLFPDAIIVPNARVTEGPLAWPFGSLFVVAGLVSPPRILDCASRAP